MMMVAAGTSELYEWKAKPFSDSSYITSYWTVTILRLQGKESFYLVSFAFFKITFLLQTPLDEGCI